MLKRTSTAQKLAQLVSHCRTLSQIQQVHCSILTRGLNKDATLLSNSIAACFSLGFSDYGHSLFTHLPEPSVHIHNTLIKSLLQKGSPKEAVLVFNNIQVSGLRPDSYSFPFALRSAIRLSSIELGQQIHSQVLRIGLEYDAHVATALVQMYSYCGCTESAREVFDEMQNSGYVPLWNAMLSGLVRVGKLDSAAQVFEKMPVQDVISWTALIAGFSQHNRPREALKMFRRMMIMGPKTDEVTMLAALSACAQLGVLELGEWIHHYIHHNKLPKTIPLQNALIDMYFKSGDIEKALRIFETMKSRSVVTWTVVVSGLALHGKGKEALEIFSQMEEDRINPNEITLLAALSACCHSGLVKIGMEFFHMMCSKYSLVPKIEHYGCLIDLLARGGNLHEAMELLRNMPFKANAAVWGSLLSAAKIHCNLDIAQHALVKLIELEPENAGNFAILSNLYAGLGRWSDCGVIRKVLRDMGIKKQLGWSSVELGREVHEFVSGDWSHPRAGSIYEVLGSIGAQLKRDGNKIQIDEEFLECDDRF